MSCILMDPGKSLQCIGESIPCRVNDSRQYAADLPQERMQVPCCLLIFSGSVKDLAK